MRKYLNFILAKFGEQAWQTANIGCGSRYVLASHELSAQEGVWANFCLLRRSTFSDRSWMSSAWVAQHIALEIRIRLKSDCIIDATSKGGVKLCLVERRVIYSSYFCLSWDVFISAFETLSARLKQFGSCTDLFWTICCRMVRSKLNSM